MVEECGVPRVWTVAGVELLGDLVDVVADLGDFTSESCEFVDVVVELSALTRQREVSLDVGHDDGADVVGGGDVQRAGHGEDRCFLVGAVADVHAFLALGLFALTAAGDSVQCGGFGGTLRQHGAGGGVDGLVPVGRPLAPELLRHPRGGGICVGPAGGRSNAIPCSA